MNDAEVLICDSNRRFTLEPIEVPPLRPRDLLVKTLYSGVSVGTESLLINGTHNWGPFPISTGYQAVGRVEALGAEVTEFKIGDRVYHRGWSVPMRQRDTAITAAGGAHSSLAVVDSASTAQAPGQLPEGVGEAEASLFVMPAVGINGLNMAAVQAGEVVVVVGAGLIGLGVIGCAALRGATVIAIDLDDKRLKMAQTLGAEHILNSSKCDVVQLVKGLAPGGADVVFEASGHPACIDLGLALCRRHGKFVFQSDFGNSDITFNFRPPHGQRVTAYFPCDDGGIPCRRAVLNLMRSGALKWKETITDSVPAAEAPQLYDRIRDRALNGSLGIVIDWTQL